MQRGYFEKALVRCRVIGNRLVDRGRQSRANRRVLACLKPPSGHIYEYFEIKSGQPEWPRGALQIIPVTFLDSSYR